MGHRVIPASFVRQISFVFLLCLMRALASPSLRWSHLFFSCLLSSHSAIFSLSELHLYSEHSPRCIVRCPSRSVIVD